MRKTRYSSKKHACFREKNGHVKVFQQAVLGPEENEYSVWWVTPVEQYVFLSVSYNKRKAIAYARKQAKENEWAFDSKRDYRQLV